MNQSHYRNLERAYLSAPIHDVYRDTVISISEGKALIEWNVQADFHHGMGALHGSVYFKLLDDACFFAANSLVPEVFVLTTSFDIDFLRPVKHGAVAARSEVIYSSRNLWVARATLTDEKSRVLATGTGRFVKSSLPVPESPK